MRGHFAEDMTGERFGSLVVVERAANRSSLTKDGKYHVKTYWSCACDCGKVKEVRTSHLKSGKIISCGCVGAKNRNDSLYKHGMAHTRLYGVWCNMKNRCYNPKVKCFKNYGGRGITVCDEWKNSFESFARWAVSTGYDATAKYGDCTIDRIDVDGNYEPANCRWANALEQAHNKRKPCSANEVV